MELAHAFLLLKDMDGNQCHRSLRLRELSTCHTLGGLVSGDPRHEVVGAAVAPVTLVLKEGKSWPTAILCGATAFVGTATFMNEVIS
ncbi:hypothetical protein GCM10022226_62200 [Sphaerisporangium flaviroseum]|uniref:Uncharacterized protein n=1 Tax=Sphaerisporangium flaviroseum TaxID=509199 RepID=A0ABP7J1P6_9ACTN